MGDPCWATVPGWGMLTEPSESPPLFVESTDSSHGPVTIGNWESEELTGERGVLSDEGWH